MGPGAGKPPHQSDEEARSRPWWYRASTRLRWLTKRPVAGTFLPAVVVFLLVLVEVPLFVEASGSSALSLVFLAAASVE